MDIASLLEVQVNEEQSTNTSGTDISDSKDNIKIQKPSQIVSSDEMLYFRSIYGNDMAQVRFKRIHCTACDVHIGSAPSEASNMREHPVLKTLLCSSCRDFYGDGNFEQGDDATDMFCRWCANGGNLYCCSYCSNTFCDKCIKRNFELDVRDKIEADEKWKCFVCDPVELYEHRALCRALLQHVKTLARILMADQKMSAKEIELKMELDDSHCCIGRRSRRRRRESSSDEGSLSRSRSPIQKRNRHRNSHGTQNKRRQSSPQNDKQNYTILNGTSRFIPIAPRYLLQEMVPSTTKYRNDEDEIPPQLLHCEQSMIEGENETVTPQGVILPVNTQSPIPDTIFYNTSVSLNPLPKQNMLQGSIARSCTTMTPTRPKRKIDALQSGKIPPTTLRFASNSKRPPAPMVKLPTILRTYSNNKSLTATSAGDSSKVQPSNYLRCKTNLTTQPNIIDLESDPEELVIIEGASVSKHTQLNNDCEKKKTQVQKENIPLTLPKPLHKRIFEEAVDNPIIAIDNMLGKLRERLKYDLDCVTNVPDDDFFNAQAKIHIINRNIDEIVNELAAFNNSMINQYKLWKQSKITSEIEHDSITKPIVLKRGESSIKYTSLNMECVRDSESDIDDSDDINIENLLNYSQRLLTFDEKILLNKETQTCFNTEDKEIQVYDTVTIDYDKTISYSLLMRADYDLKQKKEIFRPVVIHDKFFGKYEEQFISYLQYFEDHRDFTEHDGEITSPNDTLLTDIIDADMLAQKNIESFEKISDDSNNDESVEKLTISSLNKEVNERMSIIEIDDTPSEKSIELTDKLENVNESNVDVMKINDDVDINNGQMTKSQEVKNEEETVIAVRALIEGENNPDNVINKWKNAEDDDECTILE